MPMTAAGNDDARAAAPQVPRGEIRLEPPPELPEVTSDGLSQALMYLPMGAMAIGMVAVIAGGSASPVLYIGSGAMAVGMVGMMFGQVIRGKGDRKLKLNGQRRDYLRYLSQIRRKVRQAAGEQRLALQYSGPAPRSLPSLVAAGSDQIWQRSPADAGFGCVRFATGTQALSVRLVPPETKPIEDLDPLCAGALRRFIRAQGQVPGLPVEVSLRSVTRIVPTGDPGAVRALVRSLIAQVAVMHSPADVRISVCGAADRMPQWEWIKWLPHNRHPTERDAAGAVRLMAPSLGALEPMLQLHDRPRFTPGGARSAPGSLPLHVVLLDGAARDPGTDAGGVDGVVVIDLSAADAPGAVAPGPATLGLRVTPGEVYRLPPDGTAETLIGVPDALSHAEAEALGRQLAPLRPAAAGGPAEDALALNTTLTSLLGIDSLLTLDVAALRRARAPRDQLRVPIGNDADGQPVELDIKESAQGGMGPHGLVVGATGSGKSELLRTLVLGLAITHSAEDLNFVLVDFKGGATFLGLDRLPHVSAVITNLADELPLVDRMRDALHGEVVRRQELLRAAGNYASLRDYAKARAEGGPGGGRGVALPPVPSLFVVLDEFSELLAAKPEFIDLFVTIGRVGRSLGVHLLLASQRLEEGRLRGLDTQLSYRIGLRTFSAQESRTVLGVPDAYELPSQPGNGYLKDGTSGLTRFKAAYVSGSLTTAADDRPAGPRMRPGIARFGPGYVEPQFIDAPAGEGRDAAAGVGRTARPGGPGAQPDPARRRGGPAVRARVAGPVGAPDMAAAAGRPARPRPAAARAGRAADAARRARDRGPALRAAPRPAVGRPVRQRRARGGGRRAAQRQVDRAAHADQLAGPAAHPGPGAVLHPGFRRRIDGLRSAACRTWAGSRAGSRATGCAVRSPRCGPCSNSGSANSASAASTRSPPTAGCGPKARSRATVSATCSSSWTAGSPCARTTKTSSRPSPRWRPGASVTASTWWPRPTSGRSSARPSATCSGRASNCASVTRTNPKSAGPRRGTSRPARRDAA